MRRAAPGVLLGIALMAGYLATMASAEPRMRVVYHAPLLSIDASEVSVTEILREVGRAVGFSVVEAGSSDARLSFSIRDASLPAALQQLLRSEDHVLLYRDGTQDIDAVMLLGARVARTPTPLQTQDQGGKNPPPEISGGPSSTATDLAEYRRWTEASPEVVNATDLLLRHAGSGVAASTTPPASGSGPGAPSSTISTDAGAVDASSTLATTTRLAQQNLMKLVQGLAAATSSMRSSQRR